MIPPVFFPFSFSLPVQRSSRWILSVSQKLVSSDPVIHIYGFLDNGWKTKDRKRFHDASFKPEGKLLHACIISRRKEKFVPFLLSLFLFSFLLLLFRINAVESGKDIFDATSNIVTQYSKDEKARDAWGVAPNVACEIDGLPRWKLIRVFTWTTSGSIESVTRPCE